MISREVGRGVVAERHALTPDQAKAARNLLGWSRERLAAMSGATRTTVSNYERHGRLTRAADGRLGVDQLAALRMVLEAAGIVFTEEGEAGSGVRLQKSAGVA